MRQCAFCSNDASSGEHLWSDWIGRLFTSSGYNVRHRNSSGNLVKLWRAPTTGVKTNFVCRECNNTWMSDIELNARATVGDIIRYGAQVSLLARGVSALADFAFKSTVIANHMNPLDNTPFFSPFERRRFRESRLIPNGVQMWIGAFAGKYSHSGVFESYYAMPKASLADIEFGRDGQVQRRAHEGWHPARPRWPPSQLQRRTRQILRQVSYRRRRPFHRGQGAHRWLLYLVSKVPRRGHRVGQAWAQLQRRRLRSRNPPGLFRTGRDPLGGYSLCAHFPAWARIIAGKLPAP